MRLAILAAALALAACQPETPDAPAVAERENTGQDDPRAPEQPPAVKMTPVVFPALSKTAEAFTGAISLTAISPDGPNDTPSMILEGETGLRYETELLPGGAQQATIIDWSKLFNTEIDLTPDIASPSPSVDIHVVTAETAPPASVNGGLCGAEKPFALAMAVPIDGAAGRLMSLAAFKGDQWPPKDDAQLCGVFNYALP